MTKYQRMVLLAALILPGSLALSQEGPVSNLFDRLKGAVAKVNPNSWKPGSAITTSMQDAIPAARWLRDADFRASDATPISSFNLKSGYYSGTIRSYCLHAGAYSPTKGSGYQIAVLKGTQAKLINAILSRSASHREIPQSDVQVLIWGIEAGNKFSNYPPDFQARVQPLLTAGEIAMMQVDVATLLDRIVPADLQELAATYDRLRNTMNAAQINYDQIESVAVKTGLPPLGIGSREIPDGLWSYIGSGFYLRAYPQGYQRTRIELYRPALLDVEWDDKHRIARVSRDGESIALEYDDSPGADIFKSAGHADVPVWRFKKITFQGTGSSERLEVPYAGLVFRGNVDDLTKVFAGRTEHEFLARAFASLGGMPLLAFAGAAKGASSEGINWSELQTQFKEMKENYDKLKEYYDEIKDWGEVAKSSTENRPPDAYLNDAAINQQISDAIKTASNPTDFNGKGIWIAHLLLMDRDLMYYVNCQLAGGCPGSNDPALPDLASHPAQPGNTAMQRLGLSPYVEN